jgi:hypothetical protein
VQSRQSPDGAIIPQMEQLSNNLVKEETPIDLDHVRYGDWKRLDSGYREMKDLLERTVFKNWVQNDTSLEIFTRRTPGIMPIKS